MANSRTCQACLAGNHRGCTPRFQGSTNRMKLTGSQPKQSSYSYKCPCKHN